MRLDFTWNLSLGLIHGGWIDLYDLLIPVPIPGYFQFSFVILRIRFRNNDESCDACLALCVHGPENNSKILNSFKFFEKIHLEVISDQMYVRIGDFESVDFNLSRESD